MDDARIKNFTSCFKDKKFLHFFYTRVRENESGQYMEFPYISPCGRELNYIRCDDLPVVFTKLTANNTLVWGDVDELNTPFEPTKIYMSEEGRIYHPYKSKSPYIGLIASKVGLEISNNFIFSTNSDNKRPVCFEWQGIKYELTNECQDVLETLHCQRQK